MRFLFRFTIFTTRAFCNGETRQQMTARQREPNSMSKSSKSGSKAYPKECPSIINASDDSKDPSSASN